MFPDEIYVFTPIGRIVELPTGATAIDFAYAVHSDIGQTCIGARVDRVPYPLSQPLESGQTVEVITAPSARPSAGWLNFVVTAKARSKIRQTLKSLRRDESVILGKRQLIHSLSPYKLEDIDAQRLQVLLAELKLNDFDDLLAEIGLGNQMSAVIAHSLLGEKIAIDTDGIPNNHKDSSLIIKGAEGLLISCAKCCHPVPGDPIIAFVSPGKGLVVHHQFCSNIVRDSQSQPEHFTSVEWEKSENTVEFDAELRIEMTNKQGILANLTSAIAATGNNIKSIVTEEREGRVYFVTLLISTHDVQQLNGIIKKLSSVSGVIEIVRNINE